MRGTRYIMPPTPCPSFSIDVLPLDVLGVSRYSYELRAEGGEVVGMGAPYDTEAQALADAEAHLDYLAGRVDL